jgi:hypothetical protein
MDKFKIEFRWASIFTAINLVWVYVEKSLGFHDELSYVHPVLSLLLIFPIAACIFFSLKQKKEKYYSGNITWQKAFISGALLSLLIAALSIGTTYVMSQYISPDFFSNAIQKSVENGADENFVQQSFNLNAYIKDTMMFYLASGIMISAIVALVIKSKAKA